jgi:hypothetical protein
VRVAISGQAVKEHPLDWFYRLRSLCGPIQGEIKRVAVNTFIGLPLSNRVSLFRTLKKVRIHITDARLYVANIADSFQHIEALRASKSKVLRGAVDGAAASASVFTPANDKFEDALHHSPAGLRALAGQFLLNSALRPCRAFDEGHSNVVQWVEQQRTVVLANANTRTLLYKPESLIEVRSAGSVHAQAADIAAGIAREMWMSGSLVRLAR